MFLYSLLHLSLSSRRFHPGQFFSFEPRPLGIFEALLEASPELSAPLARDAGLMAWLLGRIKLRPFHANKLYATELLAVLLQQNAPNQALFGEEGGVLALLTATSYYKRREPQARAPRS